MNDAHTIFNKVRKAYEKRLSFLPESYQRFVDKLSDFNKIQAMYLGAYLYDLDYQIKAEALIEHLEHHIFLFEKDHVKTLPLDIYLNFVLDMRVNTEQFQASQSFFYKQVKYLLQEDLEGTVRDINYWAFSHVHYGPTDGRTRNSIETFISGIGRCGEQSTFLVDVLRSVGIPARQIYVPWWTHSDDRHAWVEVYLNNQWHYLGACEPEPVIDRAWFDLASQQAGLLHTPLFSDIDNNYEFASQTKDHYKTINVTERYTITKPLIVKNEVAGINEFALCVFNYGSLNILSRHRFIGDRCKLNYGQGSVYIKAQLGHRIFLVQVNPKQTQVSIKYSDEITKAYQTTQTLAQITMNKKQPLNATLEKSAEKRKAVLQIEYERKMASVTLRKQDSKQMLSDEIGTQHSFKILQYMSEKDKEDLDAQLIIKHFQHVEESIEKYPIEIFYQYLTQNRISIEAIKDYTYLAHHFTLEGVSNEEKAASINAFVEETVKLDTLFAIPYSVRPIAFIFEQGKGTKHEKEVLKVALARAHQIPARLNEFDSTFEYFDEFKKEFNRINKTYHVQVETNTEAFTIKSAQHLFAKTVTQNSASLELSEGLYELSATVRYPDFSLDSVYLAIDVDSQSSVQLNVKKEDIINKLNRIPIKAALKSSKLDFGDGIYMIVDFNEEPSVHIAHELLNKATLLNQYKIKIIIVNKTQDKNHALIREIREKINNIELVSAPIDNEENLIRSVFAEPNVYPFVMYTFNDMCCYKHSGYQVGLIDNDWNESLFRSIAKEEVS